MLTLLPLLTLLAALPLLAALGLHLLQLPAEPLHLSQRLLSQFVPLRVLAVLARPHGLLHLFQLFAQLVDPLSDGRFGHHRVPAHTAADPIGVPLHIAPQFGLLHFAERVAEFRGSLALGSLQIVHRALHPLLQLLQVLNLAFLFRGKLVGLLARNAWALRTERLAHLAFECLLAPGEFIGLPRQVFHLVGGFLAAHTGKQLLRVLQVVRRAAGLCVALRSSSLLRRGRLAHIVHRPLQAVQDLG